MRYFQTRNATVPVKVGKVSIEFTPSYLLGGGWVGYYSTEDEKLADQLTQTPGVTEITEIEFDLLKKKSRTRQIDYDDSLLNRLGPTSQNESAADKNKPVEPPKVVSEIQVKEVHKPKSNLGEPTKTTPAKRRKTK